MKILITGGSGRIGKHVIEHLAKTKKNELWTLNRSNSQVGTDKKILLDLLKDSKPFPKQVAVKKFDLVIHMAGITHMKDTKELGEKNIMLNENFLKVLLLANKDTPLIFFSSVDVYGIKHQKFPVDVKSKCNPSSYYGKSKLFSEKLFNKNLSRVYTLRIAPMIDYEGEEDFLKRVYIPGTKIKFKSPYIRENSFSDIKSICKALDLIMCDNSGTIVNVTNGKIYCEEDFLRGSNFNFKIPKIILDIIFLVLNKIDNHFFYSLEHKFHKLFKTNTYV